MGRRLASRVMRVVAVALLVGVSMPAHALAADVTYGTPTATSVFLQGIQFTQPVVLGTQVDRVEVLLTFPGASGEYVAEVQPPGTTGSTTLTYTLDAAADQSLLPNTSITARWRVRPVGAAGVLPLGPPVTVTYADTRFSWQTAERGIVRVHWYQGDAAFGQRALVIARDAIATAEKALGVTETAPIDFFVYADATAFRQALGPSTGEFVIGRALPDIRTLFGLVSPADINGSQISVTIAHELTHIVFETATHNPYHSPPEWLNEGVAYYLSEGFTAEYRSFLAQGVADGTLYPLIGLVQVDLPGEKTFIGVAEETAAVDYLVRTYGQAGLAKLVDSYAAGRTDDEAFTGAIGKDVKAFQADWFASIHAPVPPALGPSQAPPGPLPPGWGGGGAAVTSPGSSAPAASNGRVAPPVAGSASDATAALIGLGVVVVVVLVVLAVALRSRRRSVAALAAPWPGAAPAAPGQGERMPDEGRPPSSWPSEAWSRPAAAAVPPAAIPGAQPGATDAPREVDGHVAPSNDAAEGFHARFWGEDDTAGSDEASHPPQP